ncbi:cyclase family protein, partial [Rhizobium johnstonii]|uniref:cyclase family protein n=1 Tax=Rhizobium johnstonii TaxID=3019933 RepID=UPI003F9D72D6
RAWDICGPEKYPPIFARGILLDTAAMHGVDTLPPSHPIGKADIEECLKKQGLKILPGDVVLLRTDQMLRWPDIAFTKNT